VTAIRAYQAAQHLGERRLAGSVGAEERDDLTGGDLDVNAA
jgi:hypothetical protein